MVLPQCNVDAEPAGIEAARRGGMRSIGVSRKGPLAADVFAASLAELPADAFASLLNNGGRRR